MDLSNILEDTNKPVTVRDLYVITFILIAVITLNTKGSIYTVVGGIISLILATIIIFKKGKL